MRKNNVISKNGYIGEAEVIVRYQGGRGVCKDVYADIQKFYAEWKPLNGYWDYEKSKLSKYDRAAIDKFLERTKDLNSAFFDDVVI